MRRWLLALLIALVSCCPSAQCAEEVVIHHTEPQAVQSFLLDQAHKAGLSVIEQSATRLVLHMDMEEKSFSDMWGANSYIRCTYRFRPQDDATYVTYETAAVNGVQTAPFSLSRLGDYHGKRLAFARNRLITTIENLSRLRMQFEGVYLYGLILGLKDNGTLPISEVLPATPSERAGILSGDRITRLGDLRVTDADDFTLFYNYLRHELTAEPLTLTVLSGDRKKHVTITPQFYTATELAKLNQDYAQSKH